MDYTPPCSPYIYTYIDICVYISIFPVSESEFLLYLACSVVCFQWHKLSLDKVYDSIIVRGWQVLLPVAFNANIELYPLPPAPSVCLCLCPSLPSLPCALFSPFQLIIIVFGFVFIATVVVAVSGAWQFIALAIAVHIQPSIRLSIHQPSDPPSDQATIHPTTYLLNLCTSLRRCRRFGKLHFDWPASSLAVNYISPTPNRAKGQGEGELCLWL